MYIKYHKLIDDYIFSLNEKNIQDQNNEYSSIESTKDGIAEKILNGSKNIFDKVLSPSKEKLSFPKVYI